MNRRRNASLSHRSKNSLHSAAASPAASITAPEGAEETAVRFHECQEAVEKLTEYLSHELPEEHHTDLQAHLTGCKGCFERFHFEETVLRTIRERMEQVSTPDPLRERISGLLDAEMAVH